MARVLDTLLPGLGTQPVQVIEAVLALTLVAILHLRRPWLTPLARLWRRLEPHPMRVLTALAAGLLLVHVALEWNQPRRAPAVHDEFGYLLTAETFLEGRLTNPTPPEWRALDTLHVNFVPSYNSMYPPGHPLVLAAARRWLGEPVYANWILAPLLGLAAWWMIAAWMPRRWALLGGALVALRLGLFGHWAESYMAGALPALCALVFSGALPRFLRRPSIGLAVSAAFALAAMFSVRPFEAVILGFCSVPMPWLLRSKLGVRPLLLRAVPGLVVFALVVSAVAVHNAALTGNPFRFGYELNQERHGYGVFPWSRTIGTEPDVTPHLAGFYDETRRYVAYGWTPGGFVGTRLRSFGWTWVFLVGPLFTIGCLHWKRSLRVRRLRPALPGLLSFWILVAAHPWSFTHYYAGALGYLLVFALTGMRLWCVRHRVKPSHMAGATLAAALAVVTVRIAGGTATVSTPTIPIDWLPYYTPPGLEDRRALEQALTHAGPALVFVRYGPHASLRRDWVYNRPDPTRAPVVWANDRGPDTNAHTARIYAGRGLTCVEIEASQPRRADCASWMAPTARQ